MGSPGAIEGGAGLALQVVDFGDLAQAFRVSFVLLEDAWNIAGRNVAEGEAFAVVLDFHRRFRPAHSP